MGGVSRWFRLVCVMCFGLWGCTAEEGRVLRVVRVISLGPDSASTLAVDSAGRHWLGADGAIMVWDSGGRPARVPVPRVEAPRVIGWAGGTTYLWVSNGLVTVRAAEDGPGGEVKDSAMVVRQAIGDGPVLLDVRGRAVLHGARSGAVLGHDPETLEPLWAWPALDLASTALAESPEGDRIYQALGTGDDGHRVLIRDIQTGRILGTETFAAPFAELVAGLDGVLYGLVRDGRRSAVLALRPRRQRLELLWRRRLPVAGEAADIRMAVHPEQVAVWGIGPSVGLYVLDARDGATLARTRTDPLDFAFGPGAELWALYPGELRQLR